MALMFRHNPYLVPLLFVSSVTVGCSTHEIKEMPEMPLIPSVKEKDFTTLPSPAYLTEKLPSTEIRATNATELFPASFSFPYDTVVERLLDSSNISANISAYSRLALVPPDLAERLDDLNPKVPEQSQLQNEKKTDEPITLLLERSENFKQVEVMLSKARRFVGVPYRRGGTSPRGFDCSGLVYYTLKQTGISVPRTAHDQYLHSELVKQSELRPGDLVFFRTNRRTKRITHVGIYLGDNRFIHARSGGKKVDITSLSDSYYSPRFVSGGRIL